jgi:hypothetical protein
MKENHFELLYVSSLVYHSILIFIVSGIFITKDRGGKNDTLTGSSKYSSNEICFLVKFSQFSKLYSSLEAATVVNC